MLEAARAIVGARCWSLIAGKGTGSRILLDFGERRLRSTALDNNRLRPDQRQYESDLSLFVSCAWRLDLVDEVLCGWTDFDDDTGEPPEPLHQLEGRTVTNFAIAEPGADATVEFDDGLSLRIFCDVTNKQDDFNYSIRTLPGTWTVEGNSHLTFEPAKG